MVDMENAMAEPPERLAILETKFSAHEADAAELRQSIKELTTAVQGLTKRLDKNQNMLIGAVIVFTTIGGFVSFIIHVVTDFLSGMKHG
jgi:hypothetical protein